ncbi:hypothetical protein [Alteromonas sp. 009811495]|uniref:hypothetical protein n=1 Tax=Alteromonas sp. 009811495 TaxID=3002962 RepID=UPI00237DB7AA|nr:hypothetical protein [Alteromonas sp. 009811495]WDT85122.1 hypothetical protein OZ660_14415 [Alteromonas sp. 009811495]
MKPNLAWPKTVLLLSIMLFLVTIALAFVGSLSYGLLKIYSIWGASIVGLLLFIGCLGKRICGQWTGVLIDGRFKYSLSRAQALILFILLGSAIYAITIHNLEWQNIPCKYSEGDPFSVQDSAENIRQLITSDGNHVFLLQADGCEYQLTQDESVVDSVKKSSMEIDMKFFALMGLGLSTGLMSPLLRRRTNIEGASEKVEVPPTHQEASAASPSIKAAIGNVLVNNKSDEAEFADIFVGEKLDDAEQIDLFKVQMAFFSAIVYAVYLLLLNETFLIHSGFFISDLPSIEDELLTLLLVSHGGYLSGKVIGSSIGKPAPSIVANNSVEKINQKQIASKKRKLRFQRDTISAIAEAARRRTK